jgi:Glycerol-3-phosphate dehydrogenase
MNIAVIGGGSWGTALGQLLAGKGYSVHLLVRRAEQAEEMAATRQNSRYLSGFTLAPTLSATADAAHALYGAALVVLATPAQEMGMALQQLRPHIAPDASLVCASKGIEVATLRPMREVVLEVLPGRGYAALSGPSFAREVMEEKPTAVTLGCADEALGRSLCGVFSTAYFRTYWNEDVKGVELGGAFKNVIAIAAGIIDGMEAGTNSRAALITRGLAEIMRLGAALGANPATFMGLSCAGDLILTCTGALSRNRQVGLALGRGENLADIVKGLHMVAEGVKTTEAVCALGKKHGVELPIAFAMHRVMYAGLSPGNAIEELMGRALREE